MKTTLALLLAMLLLPLAACGDETGDRLDVGRTGNDTPESSTATDPTATSGTEIPERPRLVATWSEAQARDHADWLRTRVEPRLLRGDAAAAFIADLPGALDPQELVDVDLSTAALLVAGFSECGNAGRAVIDEGGTLRYVVHKVSKQTCVWAPVRVQVFAVPREVSLAE